MGGISSPGGSLEVLAQGDTKVAAATKLNFSDMNVSDGTIPVVDAMPLYYGSQWALAINPGTATLTGLGIAGATGLTATGTVARSIASGSAFSIRRRVGIQVGAVANTACGIAASQGQILREAGFKWFGRWGIETFNADSKLIMGISESNISAGAQPSGLVNAFFVGCDSTDTNLQVMHNSITGVCTKIDLGASFPARTALSDIYEAVLECQPNANEMTYTVRNLTDGVEVSGTITTDLPISTTLLNWRMSYFTHTIAAGQICSIFGTGGKNTLDY